MFEHRETVDPNYRLFAYRSSHTAKEDPFASMTRIQNLACKSEKPTFRPGGQISQIRGGSHKASVEAFAEGLCCASGGDGGRQRVCLQTHKVCGLNVNGVRTKQPRGVTPVIGVPCNRQVCR